jgi:hypothetical protein
VKQQFSGLLLALLAQNQCKIEKSQKKAASAAF